MGVISDSWTKLTQSFNSRVLSWPRPYDCWGLGKDDKLDNLERRKFNDHLRSSTMQTLSLLLLHYSPVPALLSFTIQVFVEQLFPPFDHLTGQSRGCCPHSCICRSWHEDVAGCVEFMVEIPYLLGNGTSVSFIYIPLLPRYVSSTEEASLLICLVPCFSITG